jgi:hypothetical protein
VSLLDIHAGLTYAAIAPILGLEPVTKYAVLNRCPYCTAHAWTIHQDSRNLEEWHYCSQCKAAGSILAMAAERLEMSLEDTVKYLADRLNMSLTFDHIKVYHKSIDYARRYQEIWQTAQKTKLSREEHQLISQLGWQPSVQMSSERFQAGLGQLYGILPFIHLKQNLNRHAAGKNKLTAVVPFFKSLAQVGAFNCYTDKQEYFFAPPHSGMNAFAVGEYGFAGLPFLTSMQSNSLVVTSMLHVMLQMHAHNFSYDNSPLPLLAWRQHQAAGVDRQWSILGGRRLVLWERAPTAAILHHASLMSANLSFVGPETDHQQPQEVSGPRWRAWIHNHPAPEVINRVIRASRPYEQALRNWAETAAPADKAKLLQDAEQYSARAAELVREVVDPKLKATVGMRVRAARYDKNGVIGGYSTVIEREGKWYNTSGQIRLPAVLRITHIVVRPNGQKEYIGFLESDGVRHEFRVDKDKANWHWLREFAVNSGVFMQTDQITYQQDTTRDSFCPFDAACRLEYPTMVVGKERIGWDGSGFQFRNAYLQDGVFRQNPDFTMPDDAPGPKQHFAQLKEEVQEALQKDTQEMEVMWAFAIALCAQITAPVLELEPYCIGVKRPHGDAFLPVLYTRFNITGRDTEHWPHRWPRWIDSYARAVRVDDTGFFVARLALDSQPEKYGTIVVDGGKEELSPRALTHSADKAVMHYLRGFSQDLPKTEVNWTAWLEQTAVRMQSLFPFVPKKMMQAAQKRVSIAKSSQSG